MSLTIRRRHHYKGMHRYTEYTKDIHERQLGETLKGKQMHVKYYKCNKKQWKHVREADLGDILVHLIETD